MKIKNFQSQVCVCAASTNLKARLALRNKAAQMYSENRLKEMFHVSRQTIRHAISETWGMES